MREVHLKLNSDKCEFLKNEIEVLGFMVSSKGVSPATSKVKKIQDFPRPCNVTGIRAFVNLCGFYRCHVSHFADIVLPMNELLKKGRKFDTFHLYTDASKLGIGAALAVVKDDGTEMPVVFLSRKLQPAETRYPTVEKKLLAVIYAMRKLRKYLLDKEFTLFCDNTAVCYLFNKTEPSQRLQRWVMCTQDFTFNLKHVSGTKNAVADALSRFPPKDQSDNEDGEHCIDGLFEHMLVDEAADRGYEDWLNDIVFYFKFPGSPKVSDETKRLSLKYRMDNHHFYRKVGTRFVIIPPIQDRAGILKQVHDGHGHFGISTCNFGEALQRVLVAKSLF